MEESEIGANDDINRCQMLNDVIVVIKEGIKEYTGINFVDGSKKNIRCEYVTLAY